MSNVNMLKRAHHVFTPQAIFALARVSRVSFVLCLLVYFPVSCKINTEPTKINSHRFESRAGIIISTSNFILVPTCEIRTTFDSAGLLTN